jgi:predicted ATPase
VLTGGPCAGKSTSLGSLQARLLTAGFNVYCVPEAATLLVNGGLTWTDMTEDKATLYQLALLRTQIALEDAFLDIAKASSKPAVILCDRGTMDGRAYCSETAWQRIMDLGGYTVEQLRDERYDAVIHMVTAAIGAESFYNLENTARTETIEQARAIDEVLRQKYVGHPKLKIVNNDTPFQEKVDKVWTFISELIGSGKPKTCYRRYLLSKCPTDKDITVPFERVELRITILQQSVLEDIHLLIRRKQGKAMYFTYQNISRNNGEKQRVEHRLTQKEYRSLALQAHATHIPIVKENLSFTYAEHYFELGVFQDPAEWRGKAVLYVETDKSPEDVLRCMPPFISIEREVTKDDEFSSYTISSSGVGLTSPTLLSKEQRDKMKF